ncbi:hypothetical protein [Yersinia phage YpP-G]|uniref:Uncharacterized protein n=1 Tax=Yersinia phage YpP-G TaxID=1176764 RepID=I6QAE7_9CAUD|nr:hypothetical protein [Yersinia phage YpP-G]
MMTLSCYLMLDLLELDLMSILISYAILMSTAILMFTFSQCLQSIDTYRYHSLSPASKSIQLIRLTIEKVSITNPFLIGIT